MLFQLPNVLLNSEDYLELPTLKATNFYERINRISKITEEIDNWLATDVEVKDVKEFLNLLEVDIAANQNIEGGEEHESNWIIHSLWGDGVTEKADPKKLPSQLKDIIESDLPRVGASNAEIISWLQKQKEGLDISLEMLTLARDLSEALSGVLSINVFMSKILLGLYIIRF